jgi:hypothetical protein
MTIQGRPGEAARYVRGNKTMTLPDHEALRAGVRSIVLEVIRPNAARIAREGIGKTLVGLPLELFEAVGE